MKPAAAALVVVAAYMLARAGVYALMPVADIEEWLVRDLAMTIPRAAGFAACVLVSRRLGPRFRWGGLSASGGAIAALIAAQFLFTGLAEGSKAYFHGYKLVLGWAATVFVALFEEAVFRGLLFASLRARLSPVLAAAFSSIAFSVYHLQALPASAWLACFAFGLAACAAYGLGLGLGWLVLVHWLVDGAWFHMAIGDGALWASWARFATLAAALAASLAALDGLRSRE